MRLASPFKRTLSVLPSSWPADRARALARRLKASPLFAWLSAFALFFAQAGAAVHALEHAHDAGAPESEHCELCLAYAGLAGAMPAAYTPPPLVAAGDGSPRAHPLAQPCQREVLASIRAPPACSWPT
jgi:hypothetical protein